MSTICKSSKKFVISKINYNQMKGEFERGQKIGKLHVILQLNKTRSLCNSISYVSNFSRLLGSSFWMGFSRQWALPGLGRGGHHQWVGRILTNLNGMPVQITGSCGFGSFASLKYWSGDKFVGWVGRRGLIHLMTISSINRRGCCTRSWKWRHRSFRFCRLLPLTSWISLQPWKKETTTSS